MKDRITIILEKDIQRAARKLQGKMIQDSKENMSFSRLVNILMGEGLKKYKIK